MALLVRLVHTSMLHELHKRQFNLGFTLPELVIVVGIVGLLFGFISLNLVHVQKASSVRSTVDTLVADMQNQQVKAMAGTTAASTNGSYGIYFQSDRYTLFRGPSYVSTDSANVTVMIDTSQSLTPITFPSNTLLFQQESGEVSTYATSSSSVTVQDVTTPQKSTITVNRYGIVTSLQ